MLDRSSKRLRDPNQLAKLVVDIATGEVEDQLVHPDTGKSLAAMALGRLGGLKGGKARAAKLSSEQKTEMARKAAQVRWAAKVEK